MGNICGDSVYQQIKQKYPQDFQNYLQGSVISKEIQNRVGGVQQNVNNAAQDLQSQNLSTVDGKQKEIQDHFQSVKQNIDKSYPGGVSFLEQSKQAKLEDLVGVTSVNNQFGDIRNHLKGQFSKEQEKVNEEIAQVKNAELNQAKSQTPNLPLLQQLTPDVKQKVVNAGLNDYKGAIEAKKKEFLGSFDQKLNGESFISRFKNLLPMDRLDNLTTISKDQISKNAENFIGSPGEGKATLY